MNPLNLRAASPPPSLRGALAWLWRIARRAIPFVGARLDRLVVAIVVAMQQTGRGW